jgi:hypothetical protein
MPISWPLSTVYRTESGKKITWETESNFWKNANVYANDLVSRCNAKNLTTIPKFKIVDQDLENLSWGEKPEQDYRINNPDVNAAIIAGTYSSGWEHYYLSGFNEGRTHYENASFFPVSDAVCLKKIRNYYDNIWGVFEETNYLTNYPDVQYAVTGGFFSSGWQHYSYCGRKEKRTIRINGFTEEKSMEMVGCVCDPHWAWSLRSSDYNRNLSAIESVLNTVISSSVPQGVPQVTVSLIKHTGTPLSGLDRDVNCKTICSVLNTINQYFVWGGA